MKFAGGGSAWIAGAGNHDVPLFTLAVRIAGVRATAHVRHSVPVSMVPRVRLANGFVLRPALAAEWHTGATLRPSSSGGRATGTEDGDRHHDYDD